MLVISLIFHATIIMIPFYFLTEKEEKHEEEKKNQRLYDEITMHNV